MDKKTWPILIVLILALIFYWDILQFFGLVEAPKQASSPAVVDSTQVSPTSPDTVAPAVTSTPASASIDSIVTIDSSVVAAVDSTPPDTIVVNTNKYQVTLTNAGGGPVSIVLKEFQYKNDGPIEMIAGVGKPTPDAQFAGGTFSSVDLRYSSNLRAGSYDVTNAPLEVTYTYASPSGGQLIKRYRFEPDAYDFKLGIEVVGREKFGFERQYELFWNRPMPPTEADLSDDYTHFEAVAMMSDSREKLGDFQDNKLNQSMSGATSWIGLRTKFFATIMVPSGPTAEAALARGTETTIQAGGKTFAERKITAGLQLAVPLESHFTDSFTVYVGPLDYLLMARYNAKLEDMLDIGTTPYVGWIIKPFALAVMWLLPKMYVAIPNYGVVIIVFALLVKLLTLPLSLKSFRSMNAMKELQPKIEDLKKRYKNNAQQLNVEMMKLYKQQGVSPLSGCLPILLQMPLFIAMFSVFRSTILLREAPFVWFIDDLSRGAQSFTDPYLILVVLMVAAQFISQTLTMASNQQNKMLMYFMPLFFGFLFYKSSAGLIIYWTVFSAGSLIDYYVSRRKHPHNNPEVKTA